MPRIRRALGHLRRSTLARNTLRVTLGRSARLVLQSAYFVLIARALGAEQFGAFIAVLAFAQILAPLASWGAGDLLVKETAVNVKAQSECLGNAILLNLLVGGALLAGLVLVSAVVLPDAIPVQVVLLICASEFIFGSLLTTASQAFMAREQMGRMAALESALPAARLAAAALMIGSGLEPSAHLWAIYYLSSTAAAAFLAVSLICASTGKPHVNLRAMRRNLRQGFAFAANTVLVSIINNLDKTMLARISGLAAAGIYGAAYRVLDSAFQPISALLYSSYPRFFREGRQSVAGTLAFARRLLPAPCAFAALIAVVVLGAAPVLPRVLGDSYSESSAALSWLALLPLLRTLKYFGANALTAVGQQWLRMWSTALAAAAYVVLNLRLISLYSWHGAAIATLLTESLLTLLLWTLLARLWYREQRFGSQHVPSPAHAPVAP